MSDDPKPAPALRDVPREGDPAWMTRHAIVPMRALLDTRLRPLHKLLLAYLDARIFDPAGYALSLREVGRHLGLRRTAVQEAFAELQAAGYVVASRATKGTPCRYRVTWREGTDRAETAFDEPSTNPREGLANDHSGPPGRTTVVRRDGPPSSAGTDHSGPPGRTHHGGIRSEERGETGGDGAGAPSAPAAPLPTRPPPRKRKGPKKVSPLEALAAKCSGEYVLEIVGQDPAAVAELAISFRRTAKEPVAIPERCAVMLAAWAIARSRRPRRFEEEPDEPIALLTLARRAFRRYSPNEKIWKLADQPDHYVDEQLLADEISAEHERHALGA